MLVKNILRLYLLISTLKFSDNPKDTQQVQPGPSVAPHGGERGGKTVSVIITLLIMFSIQLVR